jgi:hypothetical protein
VYLAPLETYSPAPESIATFVSLQEHITISIAHNVTFYHHFGLIFKPYQK